MNTDYTGQGFDQLLDVIDKIKNNPNDWRIILSAWNPSDLKLMALPPCHMFSQVSDLKLVRSGFPFWLVSCENIIVPLYAVLRGQWGVIVSDVSALR